MSYQRCTIVYVSWDWSTLLATRVVEMTGRQLDDSLFCHGVCMDLAKELALPPDTHSAICSGEPSEADVIAGLPDLRRAHENKTVRRVETWEVDNGLHVGVQHAGGSTQLTMDGSTSLTTGGSDGGL
jgi:hypothetical protein